MIVLGLHSGVKITHHDPGAALVIDGSIVAVAEEERFSRMKSALGQLPIYSIRACLKEAGIAMRDVDLVVHDGETAQDLADRIRLYLAHYFGYVPEIRLINHQLAHLASAFFCSPFEDAMCLTNDGWGDLLSAALAVADRKSGIRILETRDAQNSLGLFYATMTSYLGFTPGEDEYKVMGLAPYGVEGVDLSPIIRPDSTGYSLSPSFWERTPPLASRFEPWYGAKLEALLGPSRKIGESISQRHRDIAYATQAALERAAVDLTLHLSRLSKNPRLCIAGGIGLNCSANLKLSGLPFVDEVFVQPAASDRGVALGCALQGAFEAGDPVPPLDSIYKGPSYSVEDYEHALTLTRCRYRTPKDPAQEVASLLSRGAIVALYQGRAEFGPRALGNRSILADPRKPEMKDTVNKKIKFREEFRPFAPAVLEHSASEIFEMSSPSPYMTVAFQTRPEWRARIPAVVHVNHTARVQTVSQSQNPLFYDIIDRFGVLTGVPVVMNTSFNIRGQPIVETPFDAISTFAGTGLDAMLIGPFLLEK